MPEQDTFSPSMARDAITMQDVAREVGVSKMTVSYALNGTGRMSEKTRQAVLEAAQRLGFERNPHAQRLSNGRSNNTVGLFSLWFDFGVGTQKMQLIQNTLNERGFDVPIYGAGLRDCREANAQAAALSVIRRQKPDALVCSTAGLHEKALEELRRYQNEGGVLVCYDHPVDIECDQVHFDREDNTYRATRHLLELGHRAIGFGFHGFSQPSISRIRGYERALGEFGVAARPDWLLEGQSSPNYTEGGVRLAKKYLQLREQPTAMVILNDYAALVFIGELQRAGLSCPRDISVAGHDDHPLSEYHIVPLTTVSHPSKLIAHHVGQLLLERLDNEYRGVARQITVRGELLARRSTTTLKSQKSLPDAAVLSLSNQRSTFNS